MITVLTKNYDIDDFAFLGAVIRKGVKSITGCDISRCTRACCKDCSMVVVCDDLSRLFRFCESKVEDETELHANVIITTEKIENPIIFNTDEAIIKIKRGD